MTDEGDKTEKPKPSKGALYLIPLLIVAAIALSFVLPLISNSPENSVKKVGKAFSDQDLSTFRELVDVETILSRAFEGALGSIDDLFGAPPDEASGDAGIEKMNEFDGFGSLLGAGILQAIIPELVTPLENAIEKAVEKGELRISDLTPVAGGILGDFPKEDIPKENEDLIALMKERLEVVKVNETSRSGKIAHVDLVIRDTKSDKTITLDLLLRDTGSTWQIAEVANIAELVDQLPTEMLPESLLGDPFGMGMTDGAWKSAANGP